MAGEEDRSTWLPKPPPPRPARREAAIDAALRKFDGEEAAAPVTERPERQPWTRRPQFAVAASALLLVIVGIPAALIGLRNSPRTVEQRSSPPAVRYEPAAPPAPALPPAAQTPAPPATTKVAQAAPPA